MRIGKVIGKLSLCKGHPSMLGKRYVLLLPQSLNALAGKPGPMVEELVAVDEFGATENTLVGFSEGGEAAVPYAPEKKPVDAYVGCIIDDLSLVPSAIESFVEKE